MKTALLITTYNRPAYLKRCLASVKRAGIKDVFIYDDSSTDKETLELITRAHEESGYNIMWGETRKGRGICNSLLTGIQFIFNAGYDIVINLDADAIIRNDYLDRMLELHEAFPNDIITGFHSTTKNEDGSERHEILEHDVISNDGKYIQSCRKKSVGGINMLWTKKTWTQMKPIIENAQSHRLNWDHEVSKASNGIICAVPSLVQHIGIESAMGHTGRPDVADDFKTLSLPNVTLVCVDDNKSRAEDAMMKCMKDIEFGATTLISSGMPFNIDFKNLHVVSIDKLGSKEAYSRFILKELHKYINTDYALIVQHDGYVKNPEAWLPEFLDYDYIGATWWYKDGMNVGNGGFSLRSKRLLELSATLPTTKTHPEDETICRDMRPHLEANGVKFAPDHIANKFSFEGYNQPGQWNGQFGFHGNRAMRAQPKPGMMGFIINQFLGLGDILYLVPLARHWMSLGHDVIWPIADEYFGIARHFPDIQFCKKSDWPRVPYEVPHETMHRWQYGVYQVKPLRWNRSLRYEEAMTTKYTMYRLNSEMWRDLRWERDAKNEWHVGYIAGIDWSKEYALIFQEFGNVTDGGASHKIIDLPNDGMQKIYASKILGYNLLDWANVIENATIIHAVSSSCIYLFETLQLKAKEIHLYSRRAGQRDFEMVKPILTEGKYIFHV